MNILVDIFKNFSTFSLYAPGVETNMDLNDLRSSGLTARKRIETVISRAVFDELLKEKEDSPLMEALRAAMASMTMANQIIFDSVNRRKGEVNVYKYELEAMKRSYMETTVMQSTRLYNCCLNQQKVRLQNCGARHLTSQSWSDAKLKNNGSDGFNLSYRCILSLLLQDYTIAEGNAR